MTNIREHMCVVYTIGAWLGDKKKESLHRSTYVYIVHNQAIYISSQQSTHLYTATNPTNSSSADINHRTKHK